MPWVVEVESPGPWWQAPCVEDALKCTCCVAVGLPDEVVDSCALISTCEGANFPFPPPFAVSSRCVLVLKLLAGAIEPGVCRSLIADPRVGLLWVQGTAVDQSVDTCAGNPAQACISLCITALLMATMLGLSSLLRGWCARSFVGWLWMVHVNCTLVCPGPEKLRVV